MVRGNTSSGDKNAKAGAPEAGKSTTASAASVDKPSSEQPCLVVTLGEMIGNIAHQWRQPLNTLGFTIQQLPLFYDLGKIDRDLLNQCVSNSMGLIQHMSRTIVDFRNYFRPDKEKIEFNVHDAIMNAM